MRKEFAEEKKHLNRKRSKECASLENNAKHLRKRACEWEEKERNERSAEERKQFEIGRKKKLENEMRTTVRIEEEKEKARAELELKQMQQNKEFVLTLSCIRK